MKRYEILLIACFAANLAFAQAQEPRNEKADSILKLVVDKQKLEIDSAYIEHGFLDSVEEGIYHLYTSRKYVNLTFREGENEFRRIQQDAEQNSGNIHPGAWCFYNENFSDLEWSNGAGKGRSHNAEDHYIGIRDTNRKAAYKIDEKITLWISNEQLATIDYNNFKSTTRTDSLSLATYLNEPDTTKHLLKIHKPKFAILDSLIRNGALIKIENTGTKFQKSDTVSICCPIVRGNTFVFHWRVMGPKGLERLYYEIIIPQVKPNPIWKNNEVYVILLFVMVCGIIIIPICLKIKKNNATAPEEPNPEGLGEAETCQIREILSNSSEGSHSSDSRDQEIEQSKKHICELEDDLAEKLKYIKELEDKLRNITSKATQHDEENKAQKKKLNELQSEIDKHNDVIADLNRRHEEALKLSKKTQESAINKISEECDNKIASLMQEHEEKMKAQKRAFEEEKLGLRQHIDECEKERDNTIKHWNNDKDLIRLFINHYLKMVENSIKRITMVADDDAPIQMEISKLYDSVYGYKPFSDEVNKILCVTDSTLNQMIEQIKNLFESHIAYDKSWLNIVARMEAYSKYEPLSSIFGYYDTYKEDIAELLRLITLMASLCGVTDLYIPQLFEEKYDTSKHDYKNTNLVITELYPDIAQLIKPGVIYDLQRMGYKTNREIIKPIVVY